MENDYSSRPVAGTDVNNSTTNFREKLHDHPKCQVCEEHYVLQPFRAVNLEKNLEFLTDYQICQLSSCNWNQSLINTSEYEEVSKKHNCRKCQDGYTFNQDGDFCVGDDFVPSVTECAAFNADILINIDEETSKYLCTLCQPEYYMTRPGVQSANNN